MLKYLFVLTATLAATWSMKFNIPNSNFSLFNAKVIPKPIISAIANLSTLPTRDLLTDDLSLKSYEVIMNLKPSVISVIQQQHHYESEVASDNLAHKLNDDFCRKPNCVLSASRMDSFIDWEANPCNDFYSFACGRFVSESTLHDRSDFLNAFSMTDDKIKDQLRRLFTASIEIGEIEPFKMAKMLYKSCMNSDSTEARGTEPLRTLIDSIGGWPMLENWDESAWDLEQSIMKLRKHIGQNTNNIFRRGEFGSYARLNANGSSFTRSNIERPGHLDFFLRIFRSYLIDIAVIMNANRKTVEKQIDDAIEFQRELIKLNSRRAKNVINTGAINRFRNELHVKYSLTQWLDLFHPLPLQFFVDETERQPMESSAFFDAFEKLLARTSKRTMANYFVLRIIGFSSEYMTSDMKERALHYKMELIGVKQKKESWKQCVDVVSTTLELAAERMFSKEHFDIESRDTAIEIATRIKNVYEQMLLSVQWMSAEMKSKVLLKIEIIITRMRFPKELLNEQQLNLFYRKVSIQQEKFFESVLNLTIFNADRSFRILQSGVNLDVLNGNIDVLNSIDFKGFNKISFPAGVLQRDVLAPDLPKYLNYGTSGFLLGYIFAQAFESYQQTPNGFSRNVTDEINCFIRQYENYTDPETGIRANGKHTLDGNIADITSLKVVFTSYKKWISENGNELRLPALRFSNAQFFWISYAQLFCTVSRPEKRKNLNGINPHSIERFRVIGPLSNSREFSEAFNCPANSPMNPSSKCSLL